MLEMTVVVMIIALATSMMMVSANTIMESSKQVQTESKLAAIEQALLTHRTMYDRLPCPADVSLAETNANFGAEAANPGTCTGGTPAATLSTTDLVEGGIPFKKLNLGKDFTYDGWGRRFAYAVRASSTGSASFTITALDDTGGAITVKDVSGTAITTDALYVLLSYGPDGHGGRDKAGTRFNASITTADTLDNCNCSSAAAATAYNSSYVQKPLTVTSSTDRFDDIVRFKERWQITSWEDGQQPVSNYLAFGNGAATPYFSVYKRSGDTFTKLADPATMPGNVTTAIAFSNNSTYLAVGYGASIAIYKRSGDTFTKLTDPASLPAAATFSAAFAPNNNYLAVGYRGSPFVSIYKRSGDTFTKLADPATLPDSRGYNVVFSHDSTYLAIGTLATPFINVYKRSGDTFTKLAAPATIPTATSAPGGIAFSHDSTYLALSQVTTPSFYIYKRSGDTFTKLADPSSLPSTSTGLAFSPDSTYFASSMTASPYVYIYKRSGDVFTKLSDPATLPAGAGNNVSFSHDGRYLAVSHSTTPFLTIYKRSGDTFTKISNPATLPTNTGADVAFGH